MFSCNLQGAGNVDGFGTFARFNTLRALAADNTEGYLYACDFRNNNIRRVDLFSNSNLVSTVVTGISGCWGLTIDFSTHSLYAVASLANAIYRFSVSNPSVYPISASAINIIAGQYSECG